MYANGTALAGTDLFHRFEPASWLYVSESTSRLQDDDLSTSPSFSTNWIISIFQIILSIQSSNFLSSIV